VLSRCYVDIPTDPAKRTIEEEEFMTDTQEFYEEWKREQAAEGLARGLAKGRAEGLAEGAEALSKGLDVIYRIRFGTMPPELRTVVETTKDPATLLAWLQLVETGSAETFAATVLASRAG
jgi:flagellar biosynthesis/type III secretory pathway protein FliH